MDRTDVLDGMREERDRAVAFFEGLSPDAWDAPSLCEGWRVRDVVAHLIGNLADVLAGRLADAGSEAYNRRQVDERAAATTGALLDEWRAAGEKSDALFAAMPPESWDAPIGALPGTIGQGMRRLLEDLWVHTHDARIPLGAQPTHGPGLRAALEVIAGDLPERCRALAPGIGEVEVAVDGFVERVSVAAGGDRVRITGDPIALALAGTGRIPLERAIAEGSLRVEPAVAGLDRAINVYGAPVAAASAASADA